MHKQKLIDGAWIDYPPSVINDAWNVAAPNDNNNQVQKDENSGEKYTIS